MDLDGEAVGTESLDELSNPLSGMQMGDEGLYVLDAYLPSEEDEPQGVMGVATDRMERQIKRLTDPVQMRSFVASMMERGSERTGYDTYRNAASNPNFMEAVDATHEIIMDTDVLASALGRVNSQTLERVVVVGLGVLPVFYMAWQEGRERKKRGGIRQDQGEADKPVDKGLEDEEI
ncbi:hypothetical protein [Magnetococcus sp. PR-3]|uniref:hypothetical protein n=1 Tax=Magnetococcus sp. PR-3 TaxID=3120355 RepID=UPI002FCE3C04